MSPLDKLKHKNEELKKENETKKGNNVINFNDIVKIKNTPKNLNDSIDEEIHKFDIAKIDNKKENQANKKDTENKKENVKQPVDSPSPKNENVIDKINTIKNNETEKNIDNDINIPDENKPKKHKFSFVKQENGERHLTKFGIATIVAGAILIAIIGGNALASHVTRDNTPIATKHMKPKNSSKSVKISTQNIKSQSTKSENQSPIKGLTTDTSDNTKYTEIEKKAMKDLVATAKATKQPYKVTASEIGGGYVLGNIIYYPDDADKTYNDYSITAPNGAQEGLNDNHAKDIQDNLNKTLPVINKTIEVKDKDKVSMKTFKHNDDYDTVLFYDNKPFGVVKTDKNNHQTNTVTTYYTQNVAKN